ncbi:MAG: Crp/Fnr family transcriptional regulator [Dehalobacter sp. 4CP]|uniref:Crp/Fnr family transcriptional regulator n=1 Tax=Dehalobacter sp. CP TaxID=2594474 RepID=UPI0013CD4205|nr:Crp/Fnr family transcriptional regulator [Dehalobacter sp.]NBJ14363.1 Crp/Fnr family transcriptional regulator [Dehalobacter sp. 4CP]
MNPSTTRKKMQGKNGGSSIEEIKFEMIIPDSLYPVERLYAYIELGTRKTFKKGSAVLIPGEEPKALIYILSGRIRVNLVVDDGRERFIYTAGKYNMMGRLFEAYNQYYIVALEKTEICYFTKQQLELIFQKDQEVFFDIIKNYHAKISYYMRQMAEMDLYNPTIRVVRLLYKLCMTKGVAVGDSFEIQIDLSLKRISEITGAHYVTVSKVLGGLKKKNIIEKNKNTIIIHDLKGLKRLTQETHIFSNQGRSLDNDLFSL